MEQEMLKKQPSYQARNRRGLHLAGHRFKKGKSGNPKGRPKGKKSRITEAKIEVIARTGMMPLDFMTAVYRDELYDRYVTEMLADGRTQVYRPAPGAKRIKCNVPQRLTAARDAAVYVHKRQPVGIEVSDKNQRLVVAQRLAELPLEQLEALAAILDHVAPQQELKLIGSGEAEPA
jgi:hypothetical protein